MKTIIPRPASILYPTLILLTSYTAQTLAADVVNDTWIDGNRTQPTAPTYSENGTDTDADGNIESAWYNSGGTSTPLTVIDDAIPGGNQLLNGAVAAAGAVSWVTYFAPEASPVTLVNDGDQMRVTWVFTLTGVNSASSGQGFRTAVVNSPSASRITTETTPGNSTYAGYAIFGNMRSGTLGNGNSFAIMERTNNAVSGALLSSSGVWGLRANGAGSGTPGYTNDVPYTFVMTFTRTNSTELQIDATMSGTDLGTNGNGLAVSFLDTTPDTFVFDTFNTRPQTGNDTATNFATSLFRVEFIPACVAAGVTADPANQTVSEGQSANFTITPAGATPTFQWQISTNAGVDWNNVTGGTGANSVSYTTPATIASDSGNQYRCIVNVACNSSSATSSVATLTVSIPKNLIWAGDGSVNQWDTFTPNWTGEASVFSPADKVRFDDSGDNTVPVDLLGVITPSSIVVSNITKDYTIGSTSGGSLGGVATLTKSGSGILTLTTVNGHTGKTTVNGGTLSITTGANLGATPGSFTADQLTLDGGALQVTASGSVNVNRGTTLGASGGTYTIPAGINYTNTPIITGAGSLTKIDSGSLSLPAANTYLGGTILSNGTITADNNSALGTGTATLAGGTLTFNAARTIANNVHVGDSSGITFASTANNAVVANGNLTGASSKTLTITPTGASTTGTRFRLGSGITNTFACDSDIILNGVFTFATYNHDGTHTFNGVISGSGSLGRRSTLAGTAGITVLSGDNTFTGGTGFADGALHFGINSTGSPTVTSGPIGTGTLTFESNPGTYQRLLALGGARTIGNAIAWTSGAANTNMNVVIEGSNQLTLSGDVDLGGNVRSITCSNSARTILSGSISNGGLTKDGPGQLLLNGVNSYAGLTTVSNGTLGGTGTIAGSVVVEAGGNLAPGASIGTLTINGDLTLNGTFTAEVSSISSPTADLVTGISTVNYGGTLAIVNTGPLLTTSDTFQLFSAASYQGAFANIIPSIPGAGLVWNTNTLTTDGILRIASGSSAPAATNITVIKISGSQFALDWPNGQGWKLQAQTNLLNKGLSTNWVEITGAMPPYTNTVSPANPAVFYRLVYP